MNFIGYIFYIFVLQKAYLAELCELEYIAHSLLDLLQTVCDGSLLELSYCIAVH